jgi:hypothetical protein
VRESIEAKAARYLAEGRVCIRALDEYGGTVLADVRGVGSVYTTTRGEEGWHCNCRARASCCHITAVKNVTALEPREEW